MKSNLQSLSQLLEKRFVMKMRDNVIKVYDRKKRLVLKTPHSRNITFKVGIDVLEHGII